MSILIGSGVTIFGALQSWYTSRSSRTCVTAGRSGLESGEGKITLGLGIAILILGVFWLMDVRPRLMRILSLAAFVVVGLVAVLALLTRNILDGFFGCSAPGVGSGIYLSLIGAAVGCVGCLLASRGGSDPDGRANP